MDGINLYTLFLPASDGEPREVISVGGYDQITPEEAARRAAGDFRGVPLTEDHDLEFK